MNTVNQYMNFIKPTWAPPSWVFAPVWTILYLIIAVSFGYVLYKYFKKEIKWNIALPFILNLLSNLIFTYIQFGLKNNILASVDILIILSTLLWALFSIEKKYKWVFISNLPYLAWVSFATILQLTVTYLNL